jgi:hypothetical protein
MTITTIVIDDDFPGFVCVACGHHHQYEDTTVLDHDGRIVCEDVAACEARGFVVDDGIDHDAASGDWHITDEDCDPREEAAFPYEDGSSGFYD